jgi:hypothetical protein
VEKSVCQHFRSALSNIWIVIASRYRLKIPKYIGTKVHLGDDQICDVSQCCMLSIPTASLSKRKWINWLLNSEFWQKSINFCTNVCTVVILNGCSGAGITKSK